MRAREKLVQIIIFIILIVLYNPIYTAAETMYGVILPGGLVDNPYGEAPGGYQGVMKRYRIVDDFNYDGLDDVMISGGPHSFGNAGGCLDVFIDNGDGKYIKFPDYWCRPGFMVSEMKQPSIGLLTTYYRGGISGGSLLNYSVSTERIEYLSSKDLDFSIQENREYFHQLFSDSTKLKVDKGYCTEENGKIIWKSGWDIPQDKVEDITPSDATSTDLEK
ncbi:MAG: hypothetical protein GY855_15545 [candidate division Zixibacteria bacterium]|nr:hypothetical protein [candidate division Zixibacteria bacterium]